MSTFVTGKVVDETGTGIPGLTIQALDLGGLHGDVQLGTTQTDGSGFYNCPYTSLIPLATIRVRVYSGLLLLGEQDVKDSDTSVNVILNFSVSPAGVQVFGQANYISTGNQIEFLIDNESAWSRLTDCVHAATKTIHLQQFGFDISTYQNDPSKVDPNVITKFLTPPVLNSPTLQVLLESEMADACARGVNVSVVMHHSALWGRPIESFKDFYEYFLNILLALVLPDNTEDVANYFLDNSKGPPPRNLVNVRGFAMDRPTHAKLAVIDDQAFIIGSPLVQEYYDMTQFPATGPPKRTHAIDEMVRGSDGTCHLPIHDISLLVRGPAVADIDRAILLHWNEARPNPSDPGAIPDPAPPPDPSGVKLQVVRSLCKNRFSDPTTVDKTNADLIDGKAEIIQAYLGAIAQAKNFIYIENQYFVEDQITQALIQRMHDVSGLVLILVLNNWPDIPFYASGAGGTIPILGTLIDFFCEGRQQNRLEDILEGLSPAEFDKRIGAYSLWTHENYGTPSKPTIINNYLHSKVAIIDDIWATVGSANIDVFSLSNEDNSEVNVVMFEDSKAQIQEFRGRLWGEHLGVDPSVIASTTDIFSLWNNKATDKVKALQGAPPQVIDCRILPFPPFPHAASKNIGFDIYKSDKFLSGLNIDPRNFKILRAEPSYHFADGKQLSTAK